MNAATPSFSVPLRRLFTPLHVCATSPRGAVHCAQVLTEAPSIKKQTNKKKQNKTKQITTRNTITKIDDVQISNSILLILVGKLHFIVLLIVTYVSLSFPPSFFISCLTYFLFFRMRRSCTSWSKQGVTSERWTHMAPYVSPSPSPSSLLHLTHPPSLPFHLLLLLLSLTSLTLLFLDSTTYCCASAELSNRTVLGEKRCADHRA